MACNIKQEKIGLWIEGSWEARSKLVEERNVRGWLLMFGYELNVKVGMDFIFEQMLCYWLVCVKTLSFLCIVHEWN